MNARTPWQKIAKPVDIGEAAAFILSIEANFITGAAITVDGGRTSVA